MAQYIYPNFHLKHEGDEKKYFREDRVQESCWKDDSDEATDGRKVCNKGRCLKIDANLTLRLYKSTYHLTLDRKVEMKRKRSYDDSLERT